MRIEPLLWGFLPAVLATSLTALAIGAFHRRRTFAQLALTVAIALLCGGALWILFRIFVLGVWPTAVAHVMIGVAGILSIGQQHAPRS